jgi:hypothetical protein
MNITPELEHAIDLIAEAKMYFLLAVWGTKHGTPEREENLGHCERLTKKARDHVESMGGYEKLPQTLAVDLRACELGLERLAPTRSDDCH